MSPRDRQSEDHPTKKGNIIATEKHHNMILSHQVSQHSQQAIETSTRQQDPIPDSQEPQIRFMPTLGQGQIPRGETLKSSNSHPHY